MKQISKIFKFNPIEFFSKKSNTIFIMAGSTVVILLVFLVLNYFISHRVIIGIIEHNYKEIAIKQYEFIGYWFERRVENIVKNAQAPAVINGFNQSSAIGAATPALKETANSLLSDQGVYYGIAFLDNGGRVLYSSDLKGVGDSIEGIFEKSKEINDIYINDAIIIPDKKHPTVIQPICCPVYAGIHEKGGIIGYIVAYIDMAILSDSIKMMDLGDNGNAYIVDKTGRVLCSNGNFEFTNAAKGYRLVDRGTGKLVTSLEQCLKTHRMGISQYRSHRDQDVIGIWKWYSYFQWAFLIEIDRGFALSPAKIMIIFYLVSSVILIGLILFISYRVFGSMMKPVNMIIGTISEISSGNLITRSGMDARNEIGDIGANLDRFLDKISDVVRNVKDTSLELASAAHEMSSSSNLFTDNVQKQAASAEEIMSTVEELSSGLEQVSNSANDQFTSLNTLTDRMRELSDTIQDMGTRVKEGLTLTHQISVYAKSGSESLEAMNESMSTINSRTVEMTNIIEIINGISDQVNLLALNAAIEAARAGDAGRGFAVVADEISKLAEQTASSLKDIDSLIRVNNEQIGTGISQARTTVNVISEIITGVQSISQMMNLIYGNMEKQLASNETVNAESAKVKDRSNEIRAATEEQKVAAEEIVKSVSYINELSQQNASSSEEMSANAEELSGVASELSQRVDFFKV